MRDEKLHCNFILTDKRDKDATNAPSLLSVHIIFIMKNVVLCLLSPSYRHLKCNQHNIILVVFVSMIIYIYPNNGLMNSIPDTL